MDKELLLGDEAVGLGAIHAGISGAFSYPGTPATEILEFINKRSAGNGNIQAQWSANEKGAFEEAVGMSWAGRRALVSFKHVGLNVAADAFLNVAVTGVNGGLVVAVADDPGMHSSQNEQDSRYYAQFARVPCFEPRDQQTAYEMVREAFDLSERLKLPVMVRLVTRLAHSRSVVVTAPPRAQNELFISQDPKDRDRWTLLPSHARTGFKRLVEIEPLEQSFSEETDFNCLTLRNRKQGVISCGIASNYVDECLGEEHDLSTLHIGTYPLPTKKLQQLVNHVDTILVAEDGYAFIESHLRGPFGLAGKSLQGRLDGTLNTTGELDPDKVRRALGLEALETADIPEGELAARPPALCEGCPHTDTFHALKDVLDEDFDGSPVHSDIGCYTLGNLNPHDAIDSCLCMGASIGMALGAYHAGHRPAVAAIGDSTFAHGGIPSLLTASRRNADMTVFILDNGTVAMTGDQETLATGEGLVQIVKGVGVPEEHVRLITPSPRRHKENMDVIRQELAYKGLSVIIAQRACIQSPSQKPSRKSSS